MTIFQTQGASVLFKNNALINMYNFKFLGDKVYKMFYNSNLNKILLVRNINF